MNEIKKSVYDVKLNSIKGKTIAVVYFFEGESAQGGQHYWIWKSDIISGWLLAIQELNCLPFILDVRTFVQKITDGTLPHIDFVLNLNCGHYELTSMSLIPSICSFFSIPCIPCNSIAILMCENKKISNMLALTQKIPTPKTLNSTNENGIYRPLNLGSSIGVSKGNFQSFSKTGIYQEFIPGYDITIPIVFNPLTDELDLLPAILYFPDSKDPGWIYGENEKNISTGFERFPLLAIESETKNEILNFARIFPIQTFGRIDARIRSFDKTLSKDIVNHPLSLDELFFIEINSMPTIEKDCSFELAFNIASRNSTHSFYQCICEYKQSMPNSTINTFLLASSLIALSKAKYQNQTDYTHIA